MSGKSKSAAPKGRGSSRPSDQILRNNSSQHQHNALSDGQEQDEEEDAEDRTPTARKSAIHAPSSAPEASLAMQTPTQASREMLAGLDLSGEPQATPGGGMSDAIDKRVSELAASGWRPEEELAGIVGEDDDDDAYAGVDLISLSDEDDDAIRKQESRSFRQPSVPFGEQDSFARKLSISDAGSDNGEWHGFDDLDLTQGSEGFLDFDETRPASFLLADDESSFPRDRFTYDHNRKVRFQDELDGSDGESSDDDGAEAFPDIFLDTPQFTPSFQLMNDDDIYIDDGSDAGSVWDFDGEGHESQVQDDDEEDEEEWSESDGASSGYDCMYHQPSQGLIMTNTFVKPTMARLLTRRSLAFPSRRLPWSRQIALLRRQLPRMPLPRSPTLIPRSQPLPPPRKRCWASQRWQRPVQMPPLACPRLALLTWTQEEMSYSSTVPVLHKEIPCSPPASRRQRSANTGKRCVKHTRTAHPPRAPRCK